MGRGGRAVSPNSHRPPCKCSGELGRGTREADSDAPTQSQSEQWEIYLTRICPGNVPLVTLLATHNRLYSMSNASASSLQGAQKCSLSVNSVTPLTVKVHYLHPWTIKMLFSASVLFLTRPSTLGFFFFSFFFCNGSNSPIEAYIVIRASWVHSSSCRHSPQYILVSDSKTSLFLYLPSAPSYARPSSWNKKKRKRKKTYSLGVLPVLQLVESPKCQGNYVMVVCCRMISRNGATRVIFTKRWLGTSLVLRSATFAQRWLRS